MGGGVFVIDEVEDAPGDVGRGIMRWAGSGSVLFKIRTTGEDSMLFSYCQGIWERVEGRWRLSFLKPKVEFSRC